jgi:hypothetical protein
MVIQIKEDNRIYYINTNTYQLSSSKSSKFSPSSTIGLNIECDRLKYIQKQDLEGFEGIEWYLFDVRNQW